MQSMNNQYAPEVDMCQRMAEYFTFKETNDIWYK